MCAILQSILVELEVLLVIELKSWNLKNCIDFEIRKNQEKSTRWLVG